MKTSNVALIVVGSVFAFVIAASPSRTVEVVVGTQPTSFSADHARIQGEPEAVPATF